MKKFYTLVLIMILIVSSFVFSACSNQNDTAGDGGNSTNQTQQDDNQGIADDADNDNGNDNADKDNGNDDNIIDDLGDDVKKTADDVADDITP